MTPSFSLDSNYNIAVEEDISRSVSIRTSLEEKPVRKIFREIGMNHNNDDGLSSCSISKNN